jgi:transcriptional regulator with XRE-family HTH domain
MTPDDPFAQRLVVARTARGLSKAAVAAQVGCHPARVTHWETGVRVPSTASLVALAQVLEVSTDYLLGLTVDAGELPALAAHLTPANRAWLVELARRLVEAQAELPARIAAREVPVWRRTA